MDIWRRVGQAWIYDVSTPDVVTRHRSCAVSGVWTGGVVGVVAEPRSSFRTGGFHCSRGISHRCRLPTEQTPRRSDGGVGDRRPCVGVSDCAARPVGRLEL